jgi:tetratricopeptide (TPR) repeat protein
VTIPPNIYAPYREFMEMEGLAYRVVPRKGQNMINVPKLEDNIYNKFSYKGILDDDWKRDDTIYQPPFVHRLIQNYAAAFTQHALLKSRDGDHDAALTSMKVAKEIAPHLDAVSVWLGWYIFETGDTAGAIEYYRQELETRPSRSFDLLYRLAGIYERIGDFEGAAGVLEEVHRRNPQNRDALVSLVGMLMRLEQLDRAESYLRNWLVSHPNDTAVRQALDDLRKEEQPGEGQ